MDFFGDGETQCVLDCLVSDDVCRLAEGYVCDIVEDVSLELRFACVP